MHDVKLDLEEARHESQSGIQPVESRVHRVPRWLLTASVGLLILMTGAVAWVVLSRPLKRSG
jgi:hypothetical protein